MENGIIAFDVNVTHAHIVAPSTTGETMVGAYMLGSWDMKYSADTLEDFKQKVYMHYIANFVNDLSGISLAFDSHTHRDIITRIGFGGKHIPLVRLCNGNCVEEY